MFITHCLLEGCSVIVLVRYVLRFVLRYVLPLFLLLSLLADVDLL